MKITCPYCGYAGNISEKLVPDEGRIVGCPTCKKRFKVEKTSDPYIALSFPIQDSVAQPEPEPEMVIERNVVPGFEDPSLQQNTGYRVQRFSNQPLPQKNYVKISAFILIAYLSPLLLIFLVGLIGIGIPSLIAITPFLYIIYLLGYIGCFVMVIVFLSEAVKNQRTAGVPPKGKGCLIALLVYFCIGLVASVIILFLGVLTGGFTS